MVQRGQSFLSFSTLIHLNERNGFQLKISFKDIATEYIVQIGNHIYVQAFKFLVELPKSKNAFVLALYIRFINRYIVKFRKKGAKKRSGQYGNFNVWMLFHQGGDNRDGHGYVSHGGQSNYQNMYSIPG